MPLPMPGYTNLLEKADLEAIYCAQFLRRICFASQGCLDLVDEPSFQYEL